MSKRKKKPNAISLQKISKAHHHNEVIALYKAFLNKAVGFEILHLIPPQEFEKIYKVRYLPVRVITAYKQDIPGPILKDSKFMVTELFKRTNIKIDIGELTEISYHDFFSICLTCIMYAIGVKETDYPNATLVKKELAPFVALSEDLVYTKAWEYYMGTMNTIALMNSDIGNNLYALKRETRTYTDGIEGLCFCMEIYARQTEKIQVTIDEKKRPAYRVAWFFSEPAPYLDFIQVKSEEINLQAGFLLDVYTQAHALSRLAERIDGFDIGLLHFCIYDSFKNLKVCKNKKGDLLFEYRVFGHKVGYFKGDVIDGQLVLRTFLFLTNNGTPEGEKLHNNTGIMKEDKIYLTIDKLSTFVNSDIAGNKRLKDMFIKAGCEDLFKVDKSLYFSPEGTKEKSIADQITKYLKLDNIPPIENKD